MNIFDFFRKIENIENKRKSFFFGLPSDKYRVLPVRGRSEQRAARWGQHLESYWSQPVTSLLGPIQSNQDNKNLGNETITIISNPY